jgi:pSer/pThr/pTyr-binding forkhead associated (FHA) protein
VRIVAIAVALGCLTPGIRSWASDATQVAPSRLRVTRGPDAGKELRIATAARTYSIGRYQDNDLVCTDPYVSRRHAIVACRPSGCTITDVGTEGHGSTNGTFVNGKRLEAQRPAPLAVADVVRLGPNTDVVLEPVR